MKVTHPFYAIVFAVFILVKIFDMTVEAVGIVVQEAARVRFKKKSG